MSGIFSLPAWPNSGQYFDTGASMSRMPRSISMWMQTAEATFDTDIMLTMVSFAHGFA